MAVEIAEQAEPGATILCMLPDTGERYLSTPMFENIPEDMSEEEIAAAFFVSINVVKQRLRLASVAPSLLDLYADDGVTLEQLDEHAKTDALDHLILPLEAGLDDLPRVHCPESSVSKLRNGNPALVMGDVEYGEEAWATLDGLAIAVGHYKSGELHPSRVFNR